MTTTTATTATTATKHSPNYLSCRHRHHIVQAAHDRALFVALLAIIAICLLCAIADKAYGQSSASTNTSAASATTSASAPATKPEPVKSTPPSPSSSSAPSPSPYQPTPEQSKDLRIAQLEAITAQQAWNTAAMKLAEYQAFDRAVNNIGAVCQRIKVENKWPADVACDINRNPIVFGKPETQAAASTK
jgi:hypothetical protein